MDQLHELRPKGVASPHVLVCVQDAVVRDMMGCVLEDAGYASTGMDVFEWLAGVALSAPLPDVMILDAWPLRDTNLATQAQRRIAAHPTAVILLIDGSQSLPLAARLGVAVSLSLFFTRDELVTALQRAAVCA